MTRLLLRNVPARDPSYILAVLPDAEVYTDRRHDPLGAFIECFRRAGADPFVHLEDDVILCANFRERLEAAIRAYPTEVVSFFTQKRLTAHRRERGAAFVGALCFYVPAGLAPRVVRYHAGGAWPRRAVAPTSADWFFADFLRAARLSHLLWFPCLVQHKRGPGVHHPKAPPRQTAHFADDLA